MSRLGTDFTDQNHNAFASGVTPALGEIKQYLLTVVRLVVQQGEEIHELRQELHAIQSTATSDSAIQHSSGKYVLVAEAASYCRRSPCTIRRWVKKGTLTDHRPKNAGDNSPILIDKQELQAVLARLDNGSKS